MALSGPSISATANSSSSLMTSTNPNWTWNDSSPSSRPQSQLEAMPPNMNNLPINRGTYDESDSDDEDDFSPCFSPEQETLSAIQSGFSSPAIQFGTPSKSPSGFSFIEQYRSSHPSLSPNAMISKPSPTAEEAFSIAATPPAEPRRSPSSSTETSAPQHHPLTLEPTSYNRWDFEALFNKRKRWNDGDRNDQFDDDDQEAQSVHRSSPHPEMSGAGEDPNSSLDRGRPVFGNGFGRRCSRSAAGRVLVERSIDSRRSRSLVGSNGPGRNSSTTRETHYLSKLSHEILRRPDSITASAGVDPNDSHGHQNEPKDKVEEQARRKLAFEQLRKVAMERLKAVGNQLDWNAS